MPEPQMRQGNESIEDYLKRTQMSSEAPKQAESRRRLQASELPTGGISTMGYQKGKTPPYASMARYGIPAAYGITSMLTGGASLTGGAAVVAASETLARELEKASESPEYDTLAQFMLDKGESVAGGAVAGALDLLTAGIFAGAGRAAGALRKKMFLPKKTTPAITTTQRMLEGIPSQQRRYYRDVPYTQSLGQLNRVEENWIASSEQALRDAFGGRKAFGKLDKRNADVLTEKILGPYLDEAKRTMDPKAFGDFMEDMLGQVNGIQTTGKAFSPVQAWRKHLYNISDEMLKEAPSFDASSVASYLSEHGNQKLAADAWSAVNVSDITGKNLLPDITNQAAWESVSPLTADAVLKQVNRRIGRMADESEKKVLLGIHKRLSDGLKDALPEEARIAYENANEFFGKTEDIFYNSVMKQIRTTLSKSPETVVNMFSSQPSRYSRLMNLKAAMRTSAETTEKVQVLRRGTEETIPFNEYWDEQFLRPLRKNMVDASLDPATQTIDPQSFAREVQKRMKYGPEYLDEVFPEVGAQRLQDLATALQTLDMPVGRERLAINLIQGGQMVRLAGMASFAAYGAYSGDMKTAATGAAVVFFTPMAFARILSNPRYIEMFTKGIKAGPYSREFSKFLRRAAVLKSQDKIDYSNLLPDEVPFYTQYQGEAQNGMP